MARMLTYIAGVNHRPGSRERLAAMVDGEEFTLVRQPDNPYDRNAVAVFDGDFHLGFVPAVDAGAVSKAIDGGLCTRAVLNRTTATTGIEILWDSL